LYLDGIKLLARVNWHRVGETELLRMEARALLCLDVWQRRNPQRR